MRPCQDGEATVRNRLQSPAIELRMKLHLFAAVAVVFAVGAAVEGRRPPRFSWPVRTFFSGGCA